MEAENISCAVILSAAKNLLLFSAYKKKQVLRCAQNDSKLKFVNGSK